MASAAELLATSRRCISASRVRTVIRSSLTTSRTCSSSRTTLNLSLHDTLFQVKGALFGDKWQYGEDGYFKSNRFENLGGLGVFYAFSAAPSRGIEYQFVIFPNPHALPATKLPQINRAIPIAGYL